MGFSVVQHAAEQSVITWAPVDQTDVVRIGMLVSSGLGGIKPFGTAIGKADLTSVTLAADSSIPNGIVVGLSDREPTLDATYKTQYGTGVTSQANLLARSWTGVEGPYPKGDPHLYALVHIITPSSVIKGPICYSSFGGALTLSSDEDGSDTDGYITGADGSAADAASFLAGYSTIYFRTGPNAGLMRRGANTVRDAPAVYTAFPYNVDLGDVYLQVPIVNFGAGYIDIDAEGSYVNNAAAYGTNNYVVNVVELDLEVKGKETVSFMFMAQAWTFGSIAAS